MSGAMIPFAGMFLVAFVIFSVFVVPIWIFFNYLGKVKSTQTLSREDEQMLEDLWKTANRMEERVKNLETILGDHNETKL